MRSLGKNYLVLFAALAALLSMSEMNQAADPTEKEKAEALLKQAAAAANAGGKSEKAVELATAALAIDDKLSFAYYLRGRERFRLGRVRDSVEDFDRHVELRPDLASRQWERGISYYYAGQFKKGAAQFELYQTFHDNDVENSVWRYLCMVPDTGVEKARKVMLPIKNDRRVPMMQIYELYRGKLKPEDVMAAVQKGEPAAEALNARLFYAHLYLGLYYESLGDKELAKKHIYLAADKHKIGHYMWDVAHIHAQLLRGKLQLAQRDAENETGFVPLFNGRDLAGWTVMGKPEGWTVKDGVIHSDGGKGGNWLRSEKQYGDYVLRLQWKVTEGGNSGVFIRCTKEGSPWLTGYEVQILNAPRDKSHATGSLYGYASVDPIPDSSPGKWHDYEIRCQGSRITVVSDGKTCVEFDQSKSDKAKDKPLSGYIGLQDSHSKPGHYIQFRNIRIKTLD